MGAETIKLCPCDKHPAYGMGRLVRGIKCDGMIKNDEKGVFLHTATGVYSKENKLLRTYSK